MADKDFKVKQGIDLGTPLPITEGGTGQTSSTNALNALLPVQSSQSGKILETDGTNVSWVLKPAEYKRGNTASRPGSPTVGDIYVNTETAFIEIYTGTTYGWEQVGGIASTVTGVTATNQGSGRAFNNGQASVAFTPGTILGRTYTATSNPGGFTGTASSSPVIVTGLQSSTQYTYTVTATNNYGTSAASAASAGVTATTVPQAPTIGTATGGDAQASVTFTAGATGGSAITSYTVTSSPGNITASGASSPITVTGLTNGTAYTFTVTATNSNGTSLSSSASNSITPSAGDSGGMFPLGEFTLSSSQSISFTNIPQTYSHLQLRGISRTTRSDASVDGLYIRFNNDTGSNYSYHHLTGNGSSATTYSGPNSTVIVTTFNGASAQTASNIFTSWVIDILEYKNTNIFKTVKSLNVFDSNGSGAVTLGSGNWRNTNAITSIQLLAEGSFVANSNFALYGVNS